MRTTTSSVAYLPGVSSSTRHDELASFVFCLFVFHFVFRFVCFVLFFTRMQMTDTWQNEVGNIKVNDRGMRVAQRDGQEELLLEGQVCACGDRWTAACVCVCMRGQAGRAAVLGAGVWVCVCFLRVCVSVCVK